MEISLAKQRTACIAKASIFSALEIVARNSKSLGFSSDGLSMLRTFDTSGIIIGLPGNRGLALLMHCQDDCKKPAQALLFRVSSGCIEALGRRSSPKISLEGDALRINATNLGAFFISSDFRAPHVQKGGYLAGIGNNGAAGAAVENCTITLRNEFSSNSPKSLVLTACIIAK